MPLVVAVSQEVEDETPNWVRAARAVVEHFGVGRVAEDPLVLLEGVDQGGERSLWQIEGFDCPFERHEHHVVGLARVRSFELLTPPRQQREGGGCVPGLVGQVVRPSAVGVDVVCVLTDVFRQ